MSDEVNDNESVSLYGLYTAQVRYDFASDKYATSAAPASLAYDEALAQELKSYFPELGAWASIALANAWRAYSKDVGLVDEEYVCVRTPDFLGYLFVIQEGWELSSSEWITAVDAAVKILWSDVEISN
jgi:hypothetical protein